MKALPVCFVRIAAVAVVVAVVLIGSGLPIRTANAASPINSAANVPSIPNDSSPTSSPTSTTDGPIATLSPTHLTFPSQLVGTSSSPEVVTLTNTGTASFSVSNVAVSGHTSADFLTNSTTVCIGAVLAPGQSCSTSIVFTPSATGTRAATLQFTDTVANSPQTLFLAGNGFSTVTATATPPLASSTASRAWTSDGGSNLTVVKTVFAPGDPISYVGRVDNPNATSATVRVTWNVNGPSGSIYHLSANETTAPGLVPWTPSVPTTLPTDAAAGTYTFTFSVTSNGTTTSKSARFTVSTSPSSTVTPTPGSTDLGDAITTSD